MFQFPGYFKYTYYITVIAECTAFDNQFQLDDADIDLHQKQAKNATMCYASHIVSSGSHSVTHTNPMATFYISVYCICERYKSSYAYLANAYYTQGK